MQEKHQLFYLAAGKSRRMGELTDDVPKCLLSVADKSLAEHFFDSVTHCETIDDINLFVGYRADKIQSALGGSYYGHQINYFTNPLYDITGAAQTLWTGREMGRGPCVIAEGDILVAGSVLKKLMDSPHENAILVDRSADLEFGEETIAVGDSDGKLLEMAWNSHADLSYLKEKYGEEQLVGEAVFIVKMGTDVSADFWAELGKYVGGKSEAMKELPDILNTIIAKHEFHWIDCSELPWVEVDFPQDLERARTEVLPAWEVKGLTGPADESLAAPERPYYSHHFDIIGRYASSPGTLSPEYRKYRRQWNHNPDHAIVTNFPMHLDIEVSGRCNLMCKHCLRFSRRTPIGDMKFDVFKKIIDEGMAEGLKAINLSWLGESTMHPEFLKLATYAKQAGVLDVILNTNGVLFDAEMREQVLTSDCLDTIVFSLDAVSEKTYLQTKFGATYDEVEKNVNEIMSLKKKLKVHNPRIVLQILSSLYTEDELLPFVQHWRHAVDAVRISLYQSPDGNARDKLRSIKDLNVLYRCPQPWQRLAVSWDGTVYSCPYDNACRQPLGNAAEDSIKDIWHGEFMTELRASHLNGSSEQVEICHYCDMNKISDIIKPNA